MYLTTKPALNLLCRGFIAFEIAEQIVYNAYLNIWSLQIPYLLCCVFYKIEMAMQKKNNRS